MNAIDFHCHYGNWGGGPYPKGSQERMLDLLAKHDVHSALITPLNSLFSGCPNPSPALPAAGREQPSVSGRQLPPRSGEGWGGVPNAVAQENDRIFEWCSQSPGRLFPAIAVNPLMGKPALDEIRRCKAEHDVRVLKLHPWLQGFPIATPEMDAVAGLCRELGIAIMFHDGTPMYTHPLQLARLCRDFPGLTVISGHTGLGDLWREAMLAAQRYPNFILCLCGPREAGMREIVESVPPEQICVGSDFFASNPDDIVIWFRWASFRAVDMPEETRRITEYDTPARILGVTR